MKKEEGLEIPKDDVKVEEKLIVEEKVIEKPKID